MLVGRKSKKPRKIKIYIIVILVLSIVFIYPKTRHDIFNIFTSSEKELKLTSEFARDKEMGSMDIYDERIIEWKDNSLLFLDFNGFEVFKEEFTFKNPEIYWGKDNLYIMDKSLGEIKIFNKIGEEVKKIDSETAFSKIQDKEDNVLIFKKDGDDEIVDIIDEDGEILQSHLEKIPILTVDVNDRDEYLISTLDIDKELNSIASIYSKTGEELFTLDLKNEIIIYSKFIKDDLLIATDRSLYFIKNGEVKWEKEYENIKDLEVVDNDILIVYDNKFEILNLKGKIKKEIVLNQSLENILMTEDEIFIWGKNSIIIPKRKKNKLDFKSDEEILDIKYDSKNLLIQKQGKVEIYELIEKGDKANGKKY